MTLTDFLIMLSDNRGLRNEYRNDNRRPAMLERYGLENEPALKPSASLELMQERVAAENLDGLTRIELWIRSGKAPVSNDGYVSPNE